ncbi:MAG: hypothetical protein LBQ64_03330 [Bacteroidales bacterium]|nr:hypothetical protein [Bacteroidales bacterium]
MNNSAEIGGIALRASSFLLGIVSKLPLLSLRASVLREINNRRFAPFSILNSFNAVRTILTETA